VATSTAAIVGAGHLSSASMDEVGDLTTCALINTDFGESLPCSYKDGTSRS
jgi:hypothetical protein